MDALLEGVSRIDFAEGFLESRSVSGTMKFEIDLDDDIFDAQYPADEFRTRLYELAILELVRTKRMHEHEAASLLNVGRWQLVEKMRAAGLEPTEDVFAGIRDELERAVASRNKS